MGSWDPQQCQTETYLLFALLFALLFVDLGTVKEEIIYGVMNLFLKKNYIERCRSLYLCIEAGILSRFP